MTKKLRVKLDLAIVPMVSIMYMFCFIDRGNIGMDHSHSARDPFPKLST